MRPARAAKVVDASFSAVIYFREQRYREAERLICGVDLFAPTLLNYEMASAASRKIADPPGFGKSLLGGWSLFCTAAFTGWMWITLRWWKWWRLPG